MSSQARRSSASSPARPTNGAAWRSRSRGGSGNGWPGTQDGSVLPRSAARWARRRDRVRGVGAGAQRPASCCVAGDGAIPSSRRSASRWRSKHTSASTVSPAAASRVMRAACASSSSGSSPARRLLSATARGRSPALSACAASASRAWESRRDAPRARRGPTRPRRPPAARRGTARRRSSNLPARTSSSNATASTHTAGSSPTRSRDAASRPRACRRAAQRPQRVAQARPGLGVDDVGPEPGGDRRPRVGAGMEREPREHEVRPPGARNLDGAAVHLDGQLAEHADPEHGSQPSRLDAALTPCGTHGQARSHHAEPV